VSFLSGGLVLASILQKEPRVGEARNLPPLERQLALLRWLLLLFYDLSEGHQNYLKLVL